jgi:peptide/nickel transport system permease protein
MFIYILRRALYTIPILFGVVLIGFCLFHLVGGDPVYLMVGKHANPRTIAELRHELGLDLPLIQQFIFYLKQVVTLDFGRSYATKQPVLEMIWNGVGPSFTLAGSAFSVTFILALTISLIVSFFRGKLIDRVVVFFCVVGMSISSLAIILFGQYILAYKFGWFPISGFEPGFPEKLSYIVLPSLIWVVVAIGVDVRFFRTSILDEATQDYVRTARAKGLSEAVIFGKHILKNSMIPILTYVVIEIPFLILGALLLENFFGIPGLGSLVVDALHNSDWPVLKAVFPLMAVLFMLGQFATDVLYTVVDPRVKLK